MKEVEFLINETGHFNTETNETKQNIAVSMKKVRISQGLQHVMSELKKILSPVIWSDIKIGVTDIYSKNIDKMFLENIQTWMDECIRKNEKNTISSLTIKVFFEKNNYKNMYFTDYEKFNTIVALFLCKYTKKGIKKLYTMVKNYISTIMKDKIATGYTEYDTVALMELHFYHCYSLTNGNKKQIVSIAKALSIKDQKKFIEIVKNKEYILEIYKYNQNCPTLTLWKQAYENFIAEPPKKKRKT